MSIKFLDTLPTKSRNSSLFEDEFSHFQDGIVLARHHVCSTYNKCGYDAACFMIEQRFIRGDLTNNQYIGLCEELEFYASFKEELDLVPALDCGDHVDFVGYYEGQYLRFDVTTNIKNKRKSDYLRYPNHLVSVRVGDEWVYYFPSKKQGKEFDSTREDYNLKARN